MLKFSPLKFWSCTGRTTARERDYPSAGRVHRISVYDETKDTLVRPRLTSSVDMSQATINKKHAR